MNQTRSLFVILLAFAFFVSGCAREENDMARNLDQQSPEDGVSSETVDVIIGKIMNRYMLSD